MLCAVTLFLTVLASSYTLPPHAPYISIRWSSVGRLKDMDSFGLLKSRPSINPCFHKHNLGIVSLHLFPDTHPTFVKPSVCVNPSYPALFPPIPYFSYPVLPSLTSPAYFHPYLQPLLSPHALFPASLLVPSAPPGCNA